MTFWHHFPAKIRLQIIFSQIPSHPSFPGKNNHFFMVLQLSPYYFFCMRKLRILRIFVLFPQFYAGYFLNFLNFLTSIFCSGTFGTLALSSSIVPIVPLVPCDFSHWDFETFETFAHNHLSINHLQSLTKVSKFQSSIFSTAT